MNNDYKGYWHNISGLSMHVDNRIDLKTQSIEVEMDKLNIVSFYLDTICIYKNNTFRMTTENLTWSKYGFTSLPLLKA